MNDLLAKAEAMLGPGRVFWEQIKVRSHTREELERAVAATRETEYQFCQALSGRLELLVQRQSLDRSTWDYIARAREHLKIHLGRDFSPAWQALGFSDSLLQTPLYESARTNLLRQMVNHFQKHRPHQSMAIGATAARARRILAQIQLVRSHLDECQRQLRKAVRQRRRAVLQLEKIQRELISEMRQHLRQNDPRWISSELIPAAATTPVSAPPGRSRLPVFLEIPRPTGRCRSIQNPTDGPAKREIDVKTKALINCSPSPEAVGAQHQAKELNKTAAQPGQTMKLVSLLAWLFPSP